MMTMAVLMGFQSCQDDADDDDISQAGRTVLVYMAAENNLGFDRYQEQDYRFANDDILEIKQGVKTIGNNHLVLYVDKPMDGDKALDDHTPYMLHYWKGALRDSIPMEESLTSDPAVFGKVASLAFTRFPAQSYGLVLWGHATGWLVTNDSVRVSTRTEPKAYGGDTGDNTYTSAGNTWLNMSSMAKALSMVPHLKFIFADCCNFMCLESLYELHRVTDYIIGSPAEIPACGAPYQTIVPSLFEKNTFYTSIVDKYNAQQADGYDLPLSVVKTSELKQLASATSRVLKSIDEKFDGAFGEQVYPDVSGLIHYYYQNSSKQVFYDANDFFLRYAEPAFYQSWKKSLDRTVVYKKMAKMWMTNLEWNVYYSDFKMTEQRYGGVSMFIPKYLLRATDNIRIRQMAWYYAAGYPDIGW